MCQGGWLPFIGTRFIPLCGSSRGNQVRDARVQSVVRRENCQSFSYSHFNGLFHIILNIAKSISLGLNDNHLRWKCTIKSDSHSSTQHTDVLCRLSVTIQSNSVSFSTKWFDPEVAYMRRCEQNPSSRSRFWTAARLSTYSTSSQRMINVHNLQMTITAPLLMMHVAVLLYVCVCLCVATLQTTTETSDNSHRTN